MTFYMSTGVLFRTHLATSGKSGTYVIITKPTQTPGSPSMADPDEYIRIERASALAAQRDQCMVCQCVG